MERRPWSKEERRLLRVCYADTPTAELAALLERTITQVYNAAHKMGLEKSVECVRAMAAECSRRPDHGGRRFQFPKGHVAHNKGVKLGPVWTRGRMASTQFKAGAKPHTWRPLNSTRLSKEGYLQLKVTDTGYPPRDWVGVHTLLWEEAHGPVPKGHAVCFKDGDKLNVELTNLECISRAELMRRNAIHNRYPKELVNLIMLNGALKRKLRERTEDAAKQDDGSA